jgi:hypothetical protein
LQDDQLFKKAVEFGKVFRHKFEKSLRFDSTKQGMYALSGRSLLFCILALMKSALRRGLIAADSSRITSNMLPALDNESTRFADLPRHCFVSMTVAVP